MIVSSKKIDEEINKEWLIISYMIMNKDVLAHAYKRYKDGELKTRHFTRYFRPVFRWLLIHFKKYNKPPKGTIQKIFESKIKILGSEAELVSEYLSRVAEEYEGFQEQEIDPGYIIQDAIPSYIKLQEITERIEKAETMLEVGDYDSAEKQITSYEILKDEEKEDNLTFMPLTPEDVEEHYEYSPKYDQVFTFPNPALNRLVGPLERGWLVAITGIEKSGKSYLLQDIGYLASCFQNRKVLIINLELNKKQVQNRTHRRISCSANKNSVGKRIFSIFDCENNQKGICGIRNKQKNRHPLIEDGWAKKERKKSSLGKFRREQDEENLVGDEDLYENTISYFDRRDWKICTKCRFEKIRANAKRNKRFIPAIWLERTKIREVSENRVLRALKKSEMRNLRNLRIKCYPRFSANFDETRDYIYRYIDKNDFMPDMIIWDYLDILDDEEGITQERIHVDRKWKKAARMCGELNCLGITADQGTKSSREMRSLTQMSTTESKTKDSHLDIRMAISRTNREMDLGLSRISVLFHRHEEFNPTREVMVTQRLGTAQSVIDGAFWPKGKSGYFVKIDPFS